MTIPNTQATLGIVIPTLNEERVIAHNLRSILDDPTIDRIVVVDGGSSDATEDEVMRLAARAPERLFLIRAAPGRGSQMNAGADHLETDWLIFHHADSILPARVGALFEGLSDEVSWGGFRHRFAPNNWKLSIVSALHNFRCRVSGVVYGDQSMFVRREFFFRAGGFKETGLEDLEFSDRALTHERSHLLPAEVKTASRKFVQLGEFTALRQVVSIILRYERQKQLGNEGFFKPYR